MSELQEAKGFIGPQIQAKILVLQEILADRLCMRVVRTLEPIGPKDHIAYMEMVPSAMALILF
jgi:hypothetical protein